ncbi:E3 ubiquitin-protein ligase rnf213-alpha [Notothenia coriiceps]|uniref:RING-type E3 ubiquitin transferase n=1 Tax=Notothenia coriiceps TaxID=8208 RepID=A0A6I9N4E2_9TELE|nr:PREDICTED: E3 ubiquitin-protein ligase RNF213-like [Notothenia coriiceps]
MKCPGCRHTISEKNAKFCSECGHKLSVQPAKTQDTTDQPKPLVADSESASEKSVSENVDNKESNRSPKRPNDETISNPKKKKKKRKRKQKEERSARLVIRPKDMSHVSPGRQPGERRLGARADSSDSESSRKCNGLRHQESPPRWPPSPLEATTPIHSGDAPGITVEGESNALKSAQDQAPNTAPADTPTPISEDSKSDKQEVQSEKEALALEARTPIHSGDAPGITVEGESNALKSAQDQAPNTAPADTPTPISEDSKSESKTVTSQAGSGKGNKATNLQDEKTEKKGSKKKKDLDANKPPAMDQNANVEKNEKQTGQSKQKGKSQQEQKQNPMVFGPQTPSKADPTGSSVDAEETLGAQQSGSEKDSTAEQTPNKGSKQDSKEPSTHAEPPPKRSTRNKNIAARERLTIYFHAVLSKDFKFDPDKDRIFIRAGQTIGTWDENAVELSVTRDLGEHGFLVEGSLTTIKAEAVSEPIPYKYVVYNKKKSKYEFEYIYKLDSTHQTTNRCLFVKPGLVTDDGDWHQYDDIICAESSKTVLNKLTNKIKETFWPDQRKNLIQGREIAGNIMLESIFDLLRSWTDTNLRSFLIQLNQFCQVYGEPFVFEERQKKWYSLNYGEEEVRKMLKEFMLTKVIPLRKDGGGEMLYTQDPMRAAVIMLCVWRQHQFRLEHGELNQLCNMLRLPKRDKEEFLSYWEEFSQDVAIINKNLTDMLVYLIKTVKTARMPRWILVLPLFHLLKGNTKPFEVPTSGNSKYGVAWAGLQGLEIGTPAAYMNSEDRKSLVNLMKNNSHLMEVDALFVRSCMFLIPLDDLMECNLIDIELLDMLHVFTNKAPQDITSSNYQTVSPILSHIQEKLVEEKYSLLTEAYRQECLDTSVKLLEKLCKGVKPASYTQNYPDVTVACMNLVASVSDFVHSNKPQETQKGENEQHYAKELISRAMSIMRNWISQSYRHGLLNRAISSMYTRVEATAETEMWNNIMSIQFKDKDCTKVWRETFTKDFEGKYKQESAVDQIEFYCTKIEELTKSYPLVAASVERCALEAVTSLCQTKSEGKLLEKFKVNWKFGKLISAIIEKSWPKDRQGNYQDDEQLVLQHLLSWTAAKDYFKLHGADEKLINELSQDARDQIAIAISSFTAVNNQLVRGTIKTSLLKIILDRKAAFLDLLKIECLSENEQYRDNGKMKRLLQCREDELNNVYHEKELVDIVLTMSHKLGEHMTVDLEDMEERKHVNVESMQLNHFMEVHPFDQLSPPDAGVVTYFKLGEEIKNMAEILFTFRDSHIFKVCWENQAKLMVAEEMPDADPGALQIADINATPEMIHDDIFEPCYGEYKDIYTRLKNSSITLEEVNQLFHDYKGRYEELAKDLEIMCRIDKSTDKQWIHSRVQQIEQYHELHLAVASAQIIMKVKEALCLQGDFRVLETLTEVSQADFQNEPLNRIDNHLIQAKIVLVDITEARRLCLQELGLRGHFVNWVKDSLEDINELKVFVDLASISAGENDMDVDRVACFHDAVQGYSSMLYELKQDAGFNIFKEVLEKLWKALKNDSKLPDKLRDSARHLEWLKTVKDSHGSVELSSLSLASAINSKGIYLISAQNVKKLSLDSALKLQIPEENDEGQRMRWYSLEDLRELQNKLMLMSGKGDQGQNEVDHFAEVFASVQRLAEAFIALYTAGNPLFRHWEAQINCSLSSKEPSIMMDFNLGSVLSVVIVEGSIVEQLPEFCRKIEKCLDYWMNFVDKQRSEHYYLNYYTAEQIVYLCSQLTQQNVAKIEDQVLMMLSFVKPNCTASDLRQVWHTLQYEILTKPQEQNEEIEYQTFVIVPTSELGDTDFANEMDSLSLVVQANGVQTFYQIWNAYMKDMKTYLPHILDIQSLGRLLELLANKEEDSEEDESDEDISDDDTRHLIQRQLPKGLAAGNPNLIVCPHGEVLTSCISIYMSSEAESLPTYDEVLLCNSSTSYEQVELFLRRCLSQGYRGQKIYTLLYGDLLTYDVSSKVENFFQRRKMQSRKDYRLVLICSSEREHAYLPSAFSQYRLHMVPQEPLDGIERYLHKHYVVPADRCSAAAVFKDRLRVGVVSSKRAGVGKSLYIKRLYEKLKHSKKPSRMKCIRLIEPNVDENVILQSLLNTPKGEELTMFHFDVTSSVQKGLHEFLFKLLILRYLMDSEGKTWKCSDKQLYLIEMLEPTDMSTRNVSRQAETLNSTFTRLFPNIFCRPPKEVLMLEIKKQDDPSFETNEEPLMDKEEYRSAAFQRPYQYLTRFHNHNDLDLFKYQDVEGSQVECLQMLLMFCGMMDPSWAELRNFAWFLNLQLKDCESSVFCDPELTGDTGLTGFKTFVVDFMILMAKDFATPSLSISDQSPGRLQMDMTGVRDEDLAPFLIRKRWETEPHPYIFFNDDHVSMTFIGFHLEPNGPNSVDAIDPTSGRVIKKNVMTKALYEGLKLQRVPFNMDFDVLPRGEKIERLCNVLGIQWPLDPDETYELTTDNILKMLAIHMRFRCGIPVIIMGETGCGKTRLIKFLCELRRSGVATENMKLVKVHGGTTSEMIYTKIREAQDLASINKGDYGFESVLFFDEANTTDAISSIKEVLCDKTVKGESLTSDCGLQIIAACNPYRKHTDEMIQRLESAGLGYRVRAEESDEKLGSIPLRQLVYRVQALPPSMIPLVWDFGQLNDQTEKIYIQQIVQRVVEKKAIHQTYIKCITDVLSASQKYMRTKKDECSFVSLRDVERCMQSFVWFHDNHIKLFAELKDFESKQKAEKNERHHRQQEEVRDPVLWSLVMAIGVCYHACLEKKEKYRQKISKSLQPPYSPEKVMQEITLMQDLLLSGVPMGDTIARNSALKENVFMMVICIELKIPLFLVGKPGSSKSLSKTLVADAMQGQAAHSDLYKGFKQIHLVSFQCSPHSTPEGIINTFKQCGRFQEGKNLAEYISVVVLDEIGLAEDSPKMPLKTLHPLLEEGCIDDEPLPHKKVGFIGISNWALDPAKMNRGIFVSRGDPDERELIESAKGICKSDAMVLEKVRDLFQPFAKAYLNVCKKGKGFFGLRDYYSLIKMIFAVAKASQRNPTPEETIKAVLRNFSGKDDVDAVSVFTKRMNFPQDLDNISAIEFVKENIQSVGQEECRYLLVLTKNYAALQILQQTFFSENGQPEIIFGSSFPKDQEYTQICRNINRVKVCMETGQTVVLLNLQNLYESLYDALNQYYVWLGGQKYVDLGLGTHRVKCRVHRDFRLIVIEEREVVYKQFPIPLINRLEKHYMDIHTVLKTEQTKIAEELEGWLKLFVSLSNQHATVAQAYKYQPPDVFIGYHSDTCASVVLQVVETQKDSLDISDPERRVLDEAKLILLRCATPDSVVRLDCTGLPKVESENLARVYFEEQNNSCLADFILAHTMQEVHCHSFFTEVTTFSRLLTASDLDTLEQVLNSVELLSLQQFDTEYSFLKKIRNFLTADNGSSNTGPPNKILLIQSDFDEASRSANLIASAKYSSMNEINKITHESNGSRVFVYFITRLPRMEGGTSYIGFHGGPWRSVHIDDLRRSKDIVSDIKALQNMTISQMFETKMSQPEAMEVDDMYTENEHEEAEENAEENAEGNSTVPTTYGSRSSSVTELTVHEVQSKKVPKFTSSLTQPTSGQRVTGEFVVAGAIGSGAARRVKISPMRVGATLEGYTFAGASSSTGLTELRYSGVICRIRVLDFPCYKRVRPLLALVRDFFETEAKDNGQSGTEAFLASVVTLCRRSGNDWYRVYLIRKICSQHGVEFVLKQLKVDDMRWLFPVEVLQKSEEATPIDQFLVCGDDYKIIRDAVAKGIMDCKVDGLDKICEGCRCSPQGKIVNLLLALYREVTTLYREANASFHPKPKQLEALMAYIQDSKVLASPQVKAFAKALVTNQVGPLVVCPGASGANCVLADLTIHLAAVLLINNQGILAPLQQLAMAPANMQAAFLPTMPEDMLAVAQQAMGPLQWYNCPNGHPCTIGECGQPMQTSECPDCGVKIGGDNHIPVAGFQALQLQGDRTQTGHILGDDRRRDNPDMLDTKSMSPVPFTMARMLNHMAMLLGAHSCPQSISAIIKPPVHDPGAFILAHLQKDLKHLIRSLGKGTDDTVSTVHLLISSLVEPQQQQTWPAAFDNLLSTKHARNGWEMEVSNTIITPQLKNLDRRLKEVNKFLQADSRVSANPIMKLMFGNPSLFLTSLPQNSLIHGSAVWSCREKVSLLSLTHIVEQNDGKDMLPVLWRFLHREAELRLVKHLPDILTLQRDLVKKFQNITELTCGTITEFLHSQKAASLKAWYDKYINIFLTTWNQLRVSLATNGEIKIPAEFCQNDLDHNSDLKVLLPRRQGPGLCSTALVSYLIALHNDLVYCVDKHTGEETSYKVSPADLTELHVIRYELDRDLMPLVLSNTQYSIEKGQETLHEYDLPKIQQQIISRYLLGKPLITLNGIPTLVTRHDRNYEVILKDVKAKVQQEPLQTLTLSAMAGELHSYSEVCEALSTLEVALGFLATTGGDPLMQLSCYLEEVLQMGNQMAPHIFKAMSMCFLRHCVALWQLLASLKSENMLRLKRDPFVEVSGKYKQALSEEEHRLLIGFFSKSSADSFLLEMHEFLVLVLKKSNALETYRPDWSLKDTLVSYMERKDLDTPPDVEELFPGEICLSQYVEAWKFIVAFKQERGQRQ